VASSSPSSHLRSKAPVDAEARAALERAGARLDRLALYSRPVRIDRVRIFTAPWFFRLPKLRRYDGYALGRRTIVLRRPAGRGTTDDLLTHELCHVWQMQHHAFRVFWNWLTKRYEENPYELEARRAVTDTREGR
jgi:hypothetical protein